MNRACADAARRCSMISLMVPGRAENTATRSARNTASPRLWVTNTMVLRGARQQHRKILAQHHAGLLVERAERLVHEQDAGFQAERARQRRALAHAAGELARIVIGEIGKPDRLQRTAARASLVRASARPETSCRASRSRSPCSTETARSPGTRRRYRAASVRAPALPDVDGAGGRRHQPAHDAEQRALAAAARADQAEQFAARDIERRIQQRLHMTRLAGSPN